MDPNSRLKRSSILLLLLLPLLFPANAKLDQRKTDQITNLPSPPGECQYPCLPPPIPGIPSGTYAPPYIPGPGLYPPPPGYIPYFYPPPPYFNYPAPPPPDPILPYFPFYYRHTPPPGSLSSAPPVISTALLPLLVLHILSFLFLLD